MHWNIRPYPIERHERVYGCRPSPPASRITQFSEQRIERGAEGRALHRVEPGQAIADDAAPHEAATRRDGSFEVRLVENADPLLANILPLDAPHPLERGVFHG